MNGPGIVGAPVTLGDVHVEPGDIIVSDADGVVVVSPPTRGWSSTGWRRSVRPRPNNRTRGAGRHDGRRGAARD